jgi:hypothetical protein
MSTHSVITAIVATISSWLLIARPATYRSAYAVAAEDCDEFTAWHACGTPSSADAGRGRHAPPPPHAPAVATRAG